MSADATRPGMGRHLAVLAAVLVVLAPFMSLDSSFTSDEGAYAIQARAVAEGDWAYDHRLAALDPDGDRFPIANSVHSEDRWYPYVHHPLVPLVLSAGWRAPGRAVALHLFSLTGLLGCAAAAWLLAARLRPDAAPLAFWLAAAGPVLANGWLLWAHAPSAAVGGFTLLGVLAALRRPRLGAVVVTGAALALGVLLRSEGLLFAIACGGAVLAVGWGHRRRFLVVVATVIPALIGGVTKVLERSWITAITGGPAEEPARTGGSGSFLADRLDAAWHVLFQGRYADGPGWLAVAAVTLAVAAGVLLRRDEDRARRAASFLLVAATALVIGRAVATPDDPVTGLVAAWPVVAVGLGAMDRRRLGTEGMAMVVVVGLFGAAVLATQYPVGGGLEWGGRFLSPLTAPLAAVAAAMLAGRVVHGVTLLAVGGAVAALVVVGTTRRDHDRAISDVAAQGRTAIVTTESALPRLAWRLDGRVGWLLVEPAQAADAAAATAARTGGVLVAVGRSTRGIGPLPGLEPVPADRLHTDLLRLWRSR